MIGRGARGDHVVNIQSLLTETGLYTDTVHGVYDHATEEGVRNLQRAMSLPATGVWDGATNGHVLGVLDSYNGGEGTIPAQPLIPTLTAPEMPNV